MPIRLPVLVALLCTLVLWAFPVPPAGAADDTAPGAEAQEAPIVLYMTSWCPYCRKARNLLDEIDADYVEKDIEKDPEARREFERKGKGGSGIPLIDFDGEILRGFHEEKIRKMAAEVAAKKKS